MFSKENKHVKVMKKRPNNDSPVPATPTGRRLRIAAEWQDPIDRQRFVAALAALALRIVAEESAESNEVTDE